MYVPTDTLIDCWLVHGAATALHHNLAMGLAMHMQALTESYISPTPTPAENQGNQALWEREVGPSVEY